MELRGTTAIVTGGAVRLGRALALGLADEGCQIVLHYAHSQAAAEDTAREIQGRGGEVALVSADFENPEAAARQVLQAALNAFGSIEILINSAAIFEAGTLAETTNELWDRHFAINLKTPLFLSKEFARHFSKAESSPIRKGHILNILDWRGTHPAAGRSHLAYTIAKSGLAALTEALAVELGPFIQVNGIAPGAILPPPDTDEIFFESLAKNNPLHRTGSPEDIVKAAVYLLKSDFLTGEILHVDGGEHLPA
jgi:NAD(P)-dependent dehydrogenase (short-subunit alcohol dehydrogenase family)